MTAYSASETEEAAAAGLTDKNRRKRYKMENRRRQKEQDKRKKRKKGQKGTAVLFLIACLALSLAACSGTAGENGETFSEDTVQIQEEQEENVMRTDIAQNIEVVVGDQIFTAGLYDNATAQAFAERLPLTLDMSELNGNEKYYYFGESLPEDPESPSSIRSGDLMLYGSDCLVLFYEDFSTSYSYTCVGFMEDPSGLDEALGSGSVQVTFRAAS